MSSIERVAVRFNRQAGTPALQFIPKGGFLIFYQLGRRSVRFSWAATRSCHGKAKGSLAHAGSDSHCQGRGLASRVRTKKAAGTRRQAANGKSHG